MDEWLARNRRPVCVGTPTHNGRRFLPYSAGQSVACFLGEFAYLQLQVRDAGFDHGIHFDGWDRTQFGPWKRVFFIPRAKLIVLFPEGNDRLELYPFDVESALEKSGLDYLLVSSRPPA